MCWGSCGGVVLTNIYSLPCLHSKHFWFVQRREHIRLRSLSSTDGLYQTTSDGYQSFLQESTAVVFCFAAGIESGRCCVHACCRCYELPLHVYYSVPATARLTTLVLCTSMSCMLFVNLYEMEKGYTLSSKEAHH